MDYNIDRWFIHTPKTVDPIELEAFYEKHRNLIVSVTKKGGPTVRSWADPVVRNLIKPGHDCILITKLGAEPTDSWKNYAGLNPRSEICTQPLCIKNVKSWWTYIFNLKKEESAYVIIFQIMDREDDGKTPLPTFQLIVRHKQLWVRWAEITPEGKRGTLVYQAIGSMDTLWDQWTTVNITGTLSQDGWMSVRVNGKYVWEKYNYKSSSKCKEPAKLAYGVYGYPGKDVTLAVRQIKYGLI